MMFVVGSEVKVQDVGPLAVIVAVKKKELQLELDGERFWIAKRLCEVIA